MTQDYIRIKNARLNNLKNVSVEIPRNKLVAVTGLSGSGKSTLIFDTLYQECQRQFVGAHGVVTEHLQKPAVDAIEALSPAIAIDQHLTNHNPRSTVGTATEVYTYLRILYARIGHRPCPGCGKDVPAPDDTPEEADELVETENTETLVNADAGQEDTATYPCLHCGHPVVRLNMAHFSFNSVAGACPTCTGLGHVRDADLARILDPERSILDGGVLIWDVGSARRYAEVLKKTGQWFGCGFDPTVPLGQLGAIERALLLYGVHSQQVREHYPDKQPPQNVTQGNFEGIVPNLTRRYAEHITNPEYRAEIDKLFKMQTCRDCRGERIRAASRAVHIHGTPITVLAHLPLTELANWLQALPSRLSTREKALAQAILDDLHERVRRLVDVGIGYLTMERSSPSLSGGEAQRLRLAALLGSGLTGVLYILDEPTIGLHQRDTVRLLKTLRQLRDLGNTVIVVEHDLEMIRAADYVIELGPGAGSRGGQIVAVGTPEQISRYTDSITGDYLSGRRIIPDRRRAFVDNQQMLTIRGARAHNLKNISAQLPLRCMIAITGVSGSGKSSLIHDILGRAAQQRFYGATVDPEEHESIEGWQHLDAAILIDQEPLGRTPRSNAATYTGIFTAIRQTFAAQPKALELQLTPRHFSFNVPGGRCERCEGAGIYTIHMHFLPPAVQPCPACKGRRFKREVLAVTYQGHTIADVLNIMTVEDALHVFRDIPAAESKLALLVDVGLGYLRLGQAATSLSGGEVQRVKLATELARRSTGRTLYLLDEPTTGLHIDDTVRLLHILHRLVDLGNTVIVIEHNIDVIRAADWLLDLGPEGGAAGGRVVAQGTPEQVASCATSYTGQCLCEIPLRVS